MTYIELLQSDDWKTRRKEIVDKYKDRCQNCLNKKYLEKNIVPFKFIHFANESKIIFDEEPFEIKVDKKGNLFLNLNSIKKETILIITDTFNDKTQILGFCVINTIFTNDELNEEHEQLINKEVEIHEPERRQAIKNYLMKVSPIDHLKLKKNLSNRYIKDNIGNINLFKWFNIKNLHVHHKYYQKGKLPWEYPDEALITLCWDCHENLHKSLKIPFRDESGNEIGKLTPCSRCFGAGYLSKYNHVQNGICFKCNGAKYEELPQPKPLSVTTKQ